MYRERITPRSHKMYIKNICIVMKNRYYGFKVKSACLDLKMCRKVTETAQTNRLKRWIHSRIGFGKKNEENMKISRFFRIPQRAKFQFSIFPHNHRYFHKSPLYRSIYKGDKHFCTTFIPFWELLNHQFHFFRILWSNFFLLYDSKQMLRFGSQ